MNAICSPLFRADSVVRLGLTATQVFFAVGRKAQKGLCRFIKTDKLKDALSTLLAIKGQPRQIKDIRLGETKGSLKVFTDQGESYIPSAEISAFLTRYNRLASQGIQGECQCDDMWRHFCPHRIAEHLASVREKLKVVAQTLSSVANSLERKGVFDADLMARKSQLFSDLMESGNLERHIEVQKTFSHQELSLRDCVASPYSSEVVSRTTNQKLGTLLYYDAQGWRVRLLDGLEAAVNSLLEAAIVLKDPAQLSLDF
jgi:hypothetical protein